MLIKKLQKAKFFRIIKNAIIFKYLGFFLNFISKSENLLLYNQLNIFNKFLVLIEVFLNEI